MKFVVFRALVLLSCTCLACTPSKKTGKHVISLTNTADYALTNKPVTIMRSDLPEVPAGVIHPLLLSPSGDTIPAQLDDLDGDNQWDQLFFVTSLAAGQTLPLQLSWLQTAIAYKKQTSIRFGERKTRESKVEPATESVFYPDQLPGVIGYQHYQTDGPTWENDKVGFRLYLDGRNSIDVFGKKVSYITPENVGIGDSGVTEYNYAAMLDWGTDILAVGNSVGVGGISFKIGDSLARLGVTEQDTLNNVDSTRFKIILEGPVHSAMKFTYHHWRPPGRDYQVETSTSIWPGIHAFKNQVTCKGLTGDETLLVGLVNSKTEKPLTEIDVNDQWVVLLTHDKQTVDKKWWLGLALVLPKKEYQGYIKAPETGSLATTYLGQLKAENNKPVSYYAIAGWELSDPGFADSAYFTKYVTDFVKQVSAGVTVKID